MIRFRVLDFGLRVLNLGGLGVSSCLPTIGLLSIFYRLSLIWLFDAREIGVEIEVYVHIGYVQLYVFTC